MVNTLIFWDYSNMDNIHLKPITYSWEIMLIEVNNLWKLLPYSLPTRSSTQKTFSSWEEITSVQASTEFTDSMKNVKEDTILNSGKLSLTVSIVSLLLLLLMRKFSACTEDYPQNWLTWNKSEESWDQPMFQILDFSVIFSGLIRIRKFRDGPKTKEESPMFSLQKLFQFSSRNMRWILSAEPIKLSKMDMNSLLRDN